MNYVEHLKLLGVDAKQIPCITGEGEPSTATEGAIGCLYMNTLNGDIYKCISINDGNYIWENLNNGNGGTDGVTQKENWVKLVDETLTENLATEFRQVFDKPYKKLRFKIVFKGSSNTTLSNVRFKRSKTDGKSIVTTYNYLKLNAGSLSNNRCFSATASFDIDDTIVITDGCLTTGSSVLAQNNATFGSENEYSKEDQNFPEFYFYLGGTIADDGTISGNVIGAGTTIGVWGCE